MEMPGRLRRALLLWCLLCILPVSIARQVGASAVDDELLLVKVRLGNHTFDEVMALTRGASGDWFIDLGAIAQLLDLAVNVHDGGASGFVVDETRTFVLNLHESRVIYENGAAEALGVDEVRSDGDGLQVRLRSVAKWWPVGLTVDPLRAVLIVAPREQLPIQARWAREARARRLRQASPAPVGYPVRENPPGLIGVPFLDQSLRYRVSVLPGGDSPRHDLQYTAFLTADLLHTDARLFLAGGNSDPLRDVRFTMARVDPGGRLLGPMMARQVEVGHYEVPGISPISFPALNLGVHATNQPLHAQTATESYSLRGDVPPGWEVELYDNGQLLGWQRAGGNGRYAFDDLLLTPGMNRFRIVLYGPQGQIREEQRIVNLGESLAPLGEARYRLTAGVDEAGMPHTVNEFDYGLARGVSLGLGAVSLAHGGTQRTYGLLRTRVAWKSLYGVTSLLAADDGGWGASASLQAGVGNFDLRLAHSRFRNEFTSELVPLSPEPTLHRSEIGLETYIPRRDRPFIRIGQSAGLDTSVSGKRQLGLTNRASTTIGAWSLGHQIYAWLYDETDPLGTGGLQLSRRIGTLGVSAQLNYRVFPQLLAESLSVQLSRRMSEGYYGTLGVLQRLDTAHSVFQSTLDKTVGAFAAGVQASVATNGTLTASVRVSTGIGHDTNRSRWFADARPVANTGTVSALVFHDADGNGRFDEGEVPIEGVGFDIDGAWNEVRTDEEGTATLSHLPVYRSLDLRIKPSTLPDSAMLPVDEGIGVVPRPGAVYVWRIPVVLTGEVDGTVYRPWGPGKRAVGGITVVLTDSRGRVVKETVTAWDGYYLFHGIPPGDYRVAAHANSRRLDALRTESTALTITAAGDIVDGVNLLADTPIAPDELRSHTEEIVREMLQGRTVVLREPAFLSGESEFLPHQRQLLEALAEELRHYPDLEFEVHFGVEAEGNPAVVRNLTHARARATSELIRRSGLSARTVPNVEDVVAVYDGIREARNWLELRPTPTLSVPTSARSDASEAAPCIPSGASAGVC